MNLASKQFLLRLTLGVLALGGLACDDWVPPPTYQVGPLVLSADEPERHFEIHLCADGWDAADYDQLWELDADWTITQLEEGQGAVYIRMSFEDHIEAWAQPLNGGNFWSEWAYLWLEDDRPRCEAAPLFLDILLVPASSPARVEVDLHLTAWGTEEADRKVKMTLHELDE